MPGQTPRPYGNPRDAVSDNDQRLESARRTANLFVGTSIALLLVGLAVLIVVS